MIKTIQLLKESFVTYKTNFKNIFNMTWPIVLLTIAAQYYSVRINNMFDAGEFNLSLTITAGIIYIVCILFIGLFLAPALSRSVQKNEDKGVFDVKEGYSFQKKNIWKFIMVNLWGLVYMLKRLAPYIIISLLLVGVTLIFKDSPIAAIITASLIGLTMLVGVILNITRFMLYKNVFFSKNDISAKDAVKESMFLGVAKMGDIWKMILAMIIIAVSLEIILKVLSMIIGQTLFGLIVGAIIMILFSMPFMLIIASKTYVKVRVGDVKLPMEDVVEVA